MKPSFLRLLKVQAAPPFRGAPLSPWLGMIASRSTSFIRLGSPPQGHLDRETTRPPVTHPSASGICITSGAASVNVCRMNERMYDSITRKMKVRKRATRAQGPWGKGETSVGRGRKPLGSLLCSPDIPALTSAPAPHPEPQEVSGVHSTSTSARRCSFSLSAWPGPQGPSVRLLGSVWFPVCRPSVPPQQAHWPFSRGMRGPH